MRTYIYGLSDEQKQQLCQIAQQRYGKASISLLAKECLLNLINREPPDLPKMVETESTMGTQRVTARLPNQAIEYIKILAGHRQCTVNVAFRDIVNEYINQNPVLSNAEIQILYQSNYQLLCIGRNVNQIAKALNYSGNASISSSYIENLNQVIKNHTEKVGVILNKYAHGWKYQSKKRKSHVPTASYR